MDRDLGKDLSWSGFKWNLDKTTVKGTEEELGWFTSRIPIMDSDDKNELMSIYTLDTTSYASCNANLPGSSCLGVKTIGWFEEQQDLFSHNFQRRDFIFMHRPIQEFMAMGNLYSITGHKEQAINCQAVNTGMFAIAK